MSGLPKPGQSVLPQTSAVKIFRLTAKTGELIRPADRGSRITGGSLRPEWALLARPAELLGYGGALKIVLSCSAEAASAGSACQP